MTLDFEQIAEEAERRANTKGMANNWRRAYERLADAALQLAEMVKRTELPSPMETPVTWPNDWSDARWTKPCLDPQHNAPGHIYIPPGSSYTHTCPSCGHTVVLRPMEVTCWSGGQSCVWVGAVAPNRDREYIGGGTGEY